MAPRIVIAFIIMFGVMFSDLNLVLKLGNGNTRNLKSIKRENLQYLFKLEKPHIALILINIYMVHNQDTEDCMAWQRGMMTL